MSRIRYVAWRLLGFGVTTWAVFTLAFVYVAVIPYSAEMFASDAVPAAPGDPLLTKYVDWLGWLLTVWDDPVVDRVVESLRYTAAYFVPATVLAIVLGVAVRTYTVAASDRRLDTATTLLTAVALGIPIFVLAFVLRRYLLVHYFDLLGTVRIYSYADGPFAARNLIAAAWPGSAMAVYLLAIQLYYTGDRLQEHAAEPFVKTARAKGAGTWRVGRHLFRNAAVPILTVLFTDLFGMVIVGMFVVEFFVGVPGVTELFIESVLGRDLPLLLTLSIGVVLVGVTANVVRDVGQLLADPRVEAE